jgi:hypothetical protein
MGDWTVKVGKSQLAVGSWQLAVGSQQLDNRLDVILSEAKDRKKR